MENITQDKNQKLSNNLKKINNDIEKAKKEKNITKNIKLLAVSKKRNIEDIKIIYDNGHRIFGENYVNELLEKYEKLPKDIEWHLIGHLQTNKVKHLLEKIPNIIIESVDSINVAEAINKYATQQIKVYIEVNIGNTETKTGADIKDIYDIAETIINKCQKLELIGIMSLGNVNNIKEFKQMIDIKDEICNKYNLNKEKFIASFGTSQDYYNAILSGSDEIRVGHTIFEI